MTRARQTLTLLHRRDTRHRFMEDLALPARTVTTDGNVTGNILARRYTVLGLQDIFLDYAGRMAAAHPIHNALAQLQVGDRLELTGNMELRVPGRISVARLSQTAAAEWRERLPQIETIRILALCSRSCEQVDKDEFKKPLQCELWEIPIVEIIWQAP